ncbi:MAG: membrane dipeptidase [Anaerolineae bacterium]
MIFVDAHRDIAYDAFYFDRDYRHSVADNRQRETGTRLAEINGTATTGFIDALNANLGLVFATLFVEPASYIAWGNMSETTRLHTEFYETPQQAHDMALRQLSYYETLAAEHDRITLVRNQAELDAVLATWADNAPIDQRQQGLVILMEGADPVMEPAQFAEWYARGVRVLGTSWTRTRYAGGTNAPGPLTDDGRALLKEMARHNALLDLSHMAQDAYEEALDTYEGHIIASHSLPTHICNTDRHIHDEGIRKLAARDGVLGIVLLASLWCTDNTELTINRVIEAVDYVCQLTGSATHVGFGSDFYAGVGSNGIPVEMDSVRDWPMLTMGLHSRGYTSSDIEAIMGGNMLRKLRQTLPQA